MFVAEVIADGHEPQLLKSFSTRSERRLAIILDDAERAADRFKLSMPDPTIRIVVRDNGRVIQSTIH